MVEVVTADVKALTLTSLNTEYTWTVPTNCVGVSFQCRDATDIFFATVSGKVATPTGDYATLKSGTAYTLPDGLLLKNSTLYFGCASAGKVVEIIFLVKA